MNQVDRSARREVWAFWVAAAAAAVGGVIPLAVSGVTGRLSAVVLPFWIAAIILATCGFVQTRGRAMVATIYFIAGLFIVYGMLAMLAVPLRLAVVGTCAPGQRCTGGLEPGLTSAENSALALAAAGGLLAIFLGFFGLLTMYRRLAPAASKPPERKIPPVAPRAAPVPAEVPAEKPAAADAPSAEAPQPEPAPEAPAEEAAASAETRGGESAAAPEEGDTVPELPPPSDEQAAELPEHDPSSSEP